MAEGAKLLITHNVLRISAQMMRLHPAMIHAYGIAKQVNADPDVIWNVLCRMEKNGLVESRMERQNPLSNRPRRRLFRLTEIGLRRAHEVLLDLQVAALSQKTMTYQAVPAFTTIPTSTSIRI